MKCQNCSTENRDNEDFCVICGVKLAVEPMKTPATEKPTSEEKPQETVAPQKTEILQEAETSADSGGFLANLRKIKKLPKSPFHWLPIAAACVAFIVWGFAYVGGEVTLTDYMVAVISLAAFAGIFFLVPKKRKVLYVVSIIITIYMALSTIGYVLLFGS